jgi:hypothetical protein
MDPDPGTILNSDPDTDPYPQHWLQLSSHNVSKQIRLLEHHSKIWFETQGTVPRVFCNKSVLGWVILLSIFIISESPQLALAQQHLKAGRIFGNYFSMLELFYLRCHSFSLKMENPVTVIENWRFGLFSRKLGL